jgi:hypothetical protein
MLRRVVLALAATSIAFAASSQVKNEAAVPQGLLKSWAGSVCNGNLRITYTFTAIKGNGLAGTYKDHEGMSVKFDPAIPSPIQANVSGNTVTIRFQKTTMVLNYVGGALVGEYIRQPDHWVPPSWRCRQQEPVRFN